MSMNLARFGLQTQTLPNAREAMIGAVQKDSAFFNNEVDESIPATKAGTAAGEGAESGFDFSAYGESKAVGTPSNDSSGASQDQDRDLGVEQETPNMAMGIDLDKLEQLKEMGVSHEVIMKSRGQINELSVQEMEREFRGSGELTKEAAAAKDTGDDMMKELAANFQKSMAMDNGEMAKDGASAIALGAAQGAGVAQMAMR